MPKLTKVGEAIGLFSENPTIHYTPTSVAHALSVTTSRAQLILNELEAEGKIEAVEFGRRSLQRARYRWVQD